MQIRVMNAKNGKKRKRAIKNNGDGPEKALKNEKKENFEKKIILVLEKIMTSKRFFARRFLANKKPGWPAFYLQIYI